MSNTMMAYQMDGPGVLDASNFREVPIPAPAEDDVLVKVRACAVGSGTIAHSRGEYGGQGLWPLIPGNELVGEVAHDPSGALPAGKKVAVGFQRDSVRHIGLDTPGSFAEYICVGRSVLHPFESSLDWPTLAAIPGSFLTASSALMDNCQAKAGQTVLIRGGTSSVGLAAATLAKAHGLTVISTTRDTAKMPRLKDLGIDEPVLDDGTISAKIGQRADIALHLTGFSTLPDTLACAAPFGTVCMLGILGGYSEMDPGKLISPHPLTYVPPFVRLTSNPAVYPPPGRLQGWVDGIAAGRYVLPIDQVFPFDRLPDAIERRASNTGFGRVILEVGN